MHMQNTNDILAKLEEIFEDTFFDGEFNFSIELTSDDVEEWDSLAQIRLLTNIEKEFGFQFDITQIEDLKSVRALTEAIAEKI